MTSCALRRADRGGNVRRSLRGKALALAVTALAVGAAPAGAASLPDGRAYELVSPAQKNGAFVNFPFTHTSIGSAQGITAAAASGDQVVFSSMLAFADPVTGNSGGYLATRTADGWKTRSVLPATPSGQQPLLENQSKLADVSDDFTTGVLTSGDNFDAGDQDFSPYPGDPWGRRIDVYGTTLDPLAPLRMTWLSRPADGSPSSAYVHASYLDRSADASRVFFATKEHLTPAAAGMAGDGGAGPFDPASVYVASPEGVELVNVDDDGELLSPCGAELAASGSMSHAVSDDGSRAVIRVPGPGGDPSCEAPAQLYLRVEGGRTLHVSRSRLASPEPTRPAEFGAATADGRIVLFGSTEPLLPGVPSGRHLYRYDAATDDLSVLASDYEDVLGFSDDGRTLYYLRAAGAPFSGEIRLLRDGVDTSVARVGGADGGALKVRANERQVRFSPDGSALAFAAQTNLTPDASGSASKIYLHVAGQGLSCA
jgi:hypothetical protein